MINKASVFLVNRLIKKGFVDIENEELYVYGTFLLISQAIFFVFVLVFGLLLFVPIESIIFFVFFRAIRKYAGGYHAGTETKCEVMSAISLLLCISVIKLSTVHTITVPLLVLAGASAVAVFIFCPLDTEEKPLSQNELKHFRKISRAVLVLTAVIILISYIFNWNILTVPLSMSLILEGILLTAGKIQKSVNGNCAREQQLKE